MKKIDEISIKALNLIQLQGEQGFIKHLVNEIYEYAGGFEQIPYLKEKFGKLKQAIINLPKIGQLVYRESDGRFFVLVGNRYITEVCKIESIEVIPSAGISHGDITLNEGMNLVESQKIWENLYLKWGETNNPTYRTIQHGIRYLSKTIQFEVVGGYDGIPKINSWQSLTYELEVIIMKLEELVAEGVKTEITNYKYHITFGEHIRREYTGLAYIKEVTEVLSGSILSQQLCEILKTSRKQELISSDFHVISNHKCLERGTNMFEILQKEQPTNQKFKKTAYQAEMELKKILDELKTSSYNSEDLAQKTRLIDILLRKRLPDWLQTSSLSGFLAAQIVISIVTHVALPDQTKYFEKVKKITEIVTKYLPLKWREINIEYWLDDLFDYDDSGVNRIEHEGEAENIEQSSIWELSEILEFIGAYFPENIKKLLKSCKYIYTLLTKFKEANKKEDYQNIIYCLSELGDFWKEVGSTQTEQTFWGNPFIYSLMFYNAGLKICQTKKLLGLEKIKNNILETEKQLLATFNSKKNDITINQEQNRQTLEEIRSIFNKKLNVFLEQQASFNGTFNNDILEERANQLQEITKELAEGLKGFIEKLVLQSEYLLGKAPCKYAFIGFGSLEKQSCTPYSDIEFAILLEDGAENNRKNLEYLKYFRNLSYIFQAKVINLCETPIPFNLFNISFDHLTGMGFCLDLGGKTPLGRCYDTKDSRDKYGELKYELIGSPSVLSQYFNEEWFKVDKFLPIEVVSFTHICGESKLSEEYKEIIKEKLSNDDIRRKRAIKLLKEDLVRYFPKLCNTECSGKAYDVKKEIYRVADRLVDDLAFFFGIIEGNTHQKIEALVGDEEKPKHISKEAGENLKIINGIANQLRLIAYTHYKQQNDRMLISNSLEEAEVSSLENFYLGSCRDILERFYYTALPFCEKLNDWLDNFCFISSEKFFDDSDKSKAVIYIRLHDYDNAKKYLEKYLSSLEECLSSRENAAATKIQCAWRDHKAELERKAAPGMVTSSTPEPKVYDKPIIYNLLGYALFQLGELDKALEYYSKSLDTEADNPSELNASAYDSIALILIYKNKCNFDEAKKNCEKALYYRKKFYDPDLALDISYNSIGTIYAEKVNILVNKEAKTNDPVNDPRSIALQNFEDALKINKKKYVYFHPDIATNLDNIGIIQKKLGNYNKALEFCEEALKIRIHCYGHGHIDVAISLNNIGNIYIVKQNLKLALEYCKKSLNIIETLYPNHNNIYSYKIFCTLALIYMDLSEYEEVLKYLEGICKLSNDNGKWFKDILEEKYLEKHEDCKKDKNFALRKKSNEGALKDIKLLLDINANVNQVGLKKGWAALHYAATNGYLEVAEILIAYKADINLKCNHHHYDGTPPCTPLDLALQKKHYKLVNLVKILLKYKCENKEHALRKAAYEGVLNDIKLLLDINVDVNEIGPKTGRAALHHAAQQGHSQAVQLLIAYGAKISLKDKDNFTPLDLAKEKKHIEVVKLIEDKLIDEEMSHICQSMAYSCVIS